MKTPKTFKPGTQVLFTTSAGTWVGEFVRKFSPARNAGPHYEIRVGNRTAKVAANTTQITRYQS